MAKPNRLNGDRPYVTLRNAFLYTYGNDGYDALSNTYNGQPLLKPSEIAEGVNTNAGRNAKLFMLSNSALASSFFELPNRKIMITTPDVRLAMDDESKKNFKLNAKDMVTSFFGWREKGNLALNISRAILFGVLKITIGLPIAIVKIAINVLKLVTEFLPNLGMIYFEQRAKKTMKNPALWNKSKYQIIPGLIFFNALAFIGRAITSPLSGMIMAWRKGNENFGFGRKHSHTVADRVLGATLAILSLALTVTIYTLLSPLMLAYIPTIIAAAPTVIMQGLSLAASIVAPYLAILGNSALVACILAFDAFTKLFNKTQDTLISLDAPQVAKDLASKEQASTAKKSTTVVQPNSTLHTQAELEKQRLQTKVQGVSASDPVKITGMKPVPEDNKIRKVISTEEVFSLEEDLRRTQNIGAQSPSSVNDTFFNRKPKSKLKTEADKKPFPWFNNGKQQP